MEKKSYQVYSLFARVVAIAWSQPQLVIFWGHAITMKNGSKLCGTLR